MMEKWFIEVWFEADRIFEREVEGKEEALSILNSFNFSNQFMYFTVKDGSDKLIPQFYYDEWSDLIVYE